MESDDEVLLSSSPSGASPPVRERKLKRLKKAIRDSQDPQPKRSDDGPLMAEEKFSESETLKFGESDEPLLSGSGSEEIDGGNDLDSGFTCIDGEEKGSGAKRALNFDALGEEADENGEDRSKEIGEESVDIRMEELEKKRLSPDRLEEEKDKEKKKKKRKKRIEGSDDDEKSKENKADKRISEKVL